MGGLFGGSPPPPVVIQAPPKAPRIGDPGVQRAAAEAARRRRRARGFRSTILSRDFIGETPQGQLMETLGS